ncbi:IS66 family insertion sequence element accessory protein TnpB [uncultured Nitrosomonas sp.]|nr:IS66 family insertion sequence element accessory protein TnpB [uncultured Nitrosomonas sp.]
MSLIANPEKIWLMVAPVDMRRGIDGLSVLVEEALVSLQRYHLSIFFQ